MPILLISNADVHCVLKIICFLVSSTSPSYNSFHHKRVLFRQTYITIFFLIIWESCSTMSQIIQRFCDFGQIRISGRISTPNKFLQMYLKIGLEQFISSQIKHKYMLHLTGLHFQLSEQNRKFAPFHKPKCYVRYIDPNYWRKWV